MPICPKCNALYAQEPHECGAIGTTMKGQAPPVELPTDPQLTPGEKVGEYVVDQRIGQGAFGTVYRAVHPLIGKQAAIKVLGHKYSFDARIASRFISEARAVNQIRHPHIIDIFSFGKLPDGRHYHIMELLEGLTLEQLLEERGFLPFAEAMQILEPIARALDAAHAKGIAHRDLKPANVFLAKGYDPNKYFPKLLDFGIAKLMSDELPREHQTITGAAVGTPYYMSPEQCRGIDVDHRTDIYAFGIMTYEVLTGGVPFRAQTAVDVLFQHINSEAIAPHTLRPELSEGVSRVVLWMLAKDRERRPQRAHQAVQAMEDATRGGALIDPANQPPPPPSAPPARAAVSSSPGETVAATNSIPPLVVPLETPPPQPFGTLPPEVAPEPRPVPFLKIGAIASVLIAAGVIALEMIERDPLPAPVAQVEQPKQEAPPPPRPRKVKIAIRETPPGTEVRDERGALLLTAPGEIEVATSTRALKLMLTAKGYKPLVREIVPLGSVVLPVEMEKEAVKPKAKTKPKKAADEVPGWDDESGSK